MRPDPSEYFDYYGLYIDLVPDGDVVDTLESQIEVTAALLGGAPSDAETRAWAPGKWTLRQVVGHVLDAERLFLGRAVHFARRDPAPLPSMDQDAWARFDGSAERPLAELVAEWVAARRSHVLFFRGLPDDAWDRTGVASGRTFSVRALAWIIAGHELHHRRQIEEWYLAPGDGAA